MHTPIRLITIALVAALAITACSAGSTSPQADAAPVDSQPAATATPMPPSAGDAQPTDAAPASDIVADAAPEAEATLPVVEHVAVPGNSTIFNLQTIFDCNTGLQVQPDGAFQVGLGCDIWQKNSLERPQTSGDYEARFDIVEARMGLDDSWYFFQIETYTSDTVSQLPNGSYAVEIDMNLDTRGDLLVLVNDPTRNGQAWGVAGVQVWYDGNDDVGANVPVSPDNGASDGYETLLFDQGLGDDPDMAWARIAPNTVHIVELAFKNTLLQSLTASNAGGGGLSLISLQTYDLFAWWAWAADTLDPLAFDFVDAYEQANVESVDNSCAWIYGGQPRPLANLCPYATPTPLPKPTRESNDGPPSCPAGTWWNPNLGICEIIN